MDLINKHTYQSGETMIVFTGAIGGSSIVIYNLVSPAPLTASGIGDGPLEIQLTRDIFASSDYIIINTKEPNGCQNFTLDECRLNSDYIGETAFSISADESTATAESPREESAVAASITALLDAISTSTVTATIDGEVPETATSTDEESLTAPLNESNVSTTTTTF